MNKLTLLIILIVLASEFYSCHYPTLEDQELCLSDIPFKFENKWQQPLDYFYEYDQANWFETERYIGFVQRSNLEYLIFVFNQSTGSLIHSLNFGGQSIHYLTSIDNNLYFQTYDQIIKYNLDTQSTDKLLSPRIPFKGHIQVFDKRLIFSYYDHDNNTHKISLFDLIEENAKLLYSKVDDNPDGISSFKNPILNINENSDSLLYVRYYFDNTEEYELIQIDLTSGETFQIAEGDYHTSYYFLENIVFIRQGHQISGLDPKNFATLWTTDLDNPNDYSSFFNLLNVNIDLTLQVGRDLVNVNSQNGKVKWRLSDPFDFRNYYFYGMDKYYYYTILNNQIFALNDNDEFISIDLETGALSTWCETPNAFQFITITGTENELFTIDHSKVLNRFILK